MKKNKMMRAASALLVAVLLTTSVISGTFAKYVTKQTSWDQARVAKFGVVITATNDMFNDSYKNLKTDYLLDETGDAITVQAATEGTNVLAPGTEGTLTGFTVTGTPEVDTEVTYVADLVLTGWDVDGAYYCPVVIKVGDTTLSGLDYTSMTEFEEDVEAAIVGCTEKYDTNKNLSTVSDDMNVSWNWAFETSDENNAKDTWLGDAAANGNAATISLTVTVTISQVD